MTRTLPEGAMPTAERTSGRESAVSKKDRINALLDQVNPLIFGTDSRLALRYVLTDEPREQDVNANVMPQGMFNALISNVSKNSVLESVPLMATREETPEVIEVVSGHHRTRAAKQAGIDGFVVLLYRGITSAEIHAKQLAHNAIQGKSDPEIVREIFQRIDSLPEQMESYIDPAIFDTLPKAVSFDMIDLDPLAEAKTVTVVFLPTQAVDFRKAVELLDADPDTVYVANRTAFDGFKAAVQFTRDELEVVSVPTAISAMARLALERLAQIRSEREAREQEATLTGMEAPIRLVPQAGLDEALLEALGAKPTSD